MASWPGRIRCRALPAPCSGQHPWRQRISPTYLDWGTFWSSPLMTATVPPSAGEVKFLRISQQMNLSLGLVAYYTFEGNANDLSGNTNNAAVTNDVTFVPGISGLAASFDGSTSYIQVNESPSLELAGPMTITAWVNPAAEGSLNCIVDKDANFLGYNLYLQNGGVQMRISSTGGTAAVT